MALIAPGEGPPTAGVRGASPILLSFLPREAYRTNPGRRSTIWPHCGRATAPDSPRQQRDLWLGKPHDDRSHTISDRLHDRHYCPDPIEAEQNHQQILGTDLTSAVSLPDHFHSSIIPRVYMCRSA